MFGKKKAQKPKVADRYPCHGKGYVTMQDASEGKSRVQYEMVSDGIPLRDFRIWQCIDGHFHLGEY